MNNYEKRCKNLQCCTAEKWAKISLDKNEIKDPPQRASHGLGSLPGLSCDDPW